MSALLFAIVVPLSAQKRTTGLERLAVVPFVNQTGNAQWDVLAASLTDTILLTLRLAEQVTVRDIGTPDPFSDAGRAEIVRAGRESRLDAILVGRLGLAEADRVTIETGLYAPSANDVVATESRTAFGAFDVLDAADELVVAVTSAITGYPVDFGALILEPSRADVVFRVYLDGALVGENINGIPQVLVGERRLDVTVVSRAGEQLVYSADLLIRAGEANTVSFPLPEITRTEADMIDTRIAFAERNFAVSGAESAVQAALDEVRDLIAGADRPGDEAALVLVQSLVDVEREFRRIDPAGYLFADSALRASEAIPVAWTFRKDLQNGGDKLGKRIRRTALAHLHMTRIAFALTLSESNWERADLLLDEIEQTQAEFGLGDAVLSERQINAYREARETSDRLVRRRRRPVPYLLSLVGAGGVGYGSYLVYTDAVGETIDDADALYEEYLAAGPDTVSTKRRAAEEKYDEAEFTELVQWSTIGAGAVTLVTGLLLAVRNIRQSDTYMRDWADDRYPRLMAVANGVAEYLEDDGRGRRSDTGEAERADLLIVGPESIVTLPDGGVDAMPLLVSVPAGEALVLDRAAVVPSDSTRVWERGFHLVVTE